MACVKRCYPSERTARIATRTAGWRVRVYYCDDCTAYHTANGEKANQHDNWSGENEWQTRREAKRVKYRRS